MEEFFKVNTGQPTGPILADFDFTEDDIEFARSELSSTSAAGPDGIPASLLKLCRKELKRPLFLLWRASLQQGVIPPDLLLVLISPIHKGGSKVDPAQYRPVALTSHIIKVFERVLTLRHKDYYHLSSMASGSAGQHLHSCCLIGTKCLAS